MTEQKKLAGKCKFFDPEKGWGFITNDDGTEVFVHYSDILMDGRKELHPGQRVEYDVVTCDDGRIKASNVTVIEDKKPDIRHVCAVVLTPDGIKPVLQEQMAHCYGGVPT